MIFLKQHFKRKSPKLSLPKEYVFFVAVILVTVFILSTSFYIYTYRTYVENNEQKLTTTTEHLKQEIQGILEENRSFLKFLGEKIAYHLDPHDLQAIHSLLSATGELSIRNMTKSFVAWARPDGKVVVSGKEGILKSNLPDISTRKYFRPAREHPWTLQQAPPTKSKFSDIQVLPLAMGIENKHGQFIGYLIIGLRIEHLNKHLKEISGQSKTSFTILDEENHVVFSSSNTLDTKTSLTKEHLLELTKKNFGFLSQPISIGTGSRMYYDKAKDCPYTILTSFDKNLFDKEFHYQILPRLGEFVFMGLFCMIALYFFRKRVINPISLLSHTALSISKGEMDVKIPKQTSVEMASLAKSLVLVKRHIIKNNTYKRKLENSDKIIKEANEAREDFIKSLNRELSYSLKDISIYTQLVLKTISEKKIAPEKLKLITDYMDKIYETTQQIKSKISPSVVLTYVDVNQLIKQAFQINLKTIFIKNIRIRFSLKENILPIYGDELKLKHLLVSLMAQYIKNSPKNNDIKISSDVFSESSHDFLQITIQDHGFGFSEEELQVIEKKMGMNEEDSLFEFARVDQAFIQKVVEMHCGEYYVKNKIHEGRVVILTFPFLNEETFGNFHKKKDNVFYIRKDENQS